MNRSVGSAWASGSPFATSSPEPMSPRMQKVLSDAGLSRIEDLFRERGIGLEQFLAMDEPDFEFLKRGPRTQLLRQQESLRRDLLPLLVKQASGSTGESATAPTSSSSTPLATASSSIANSQPAAETPSTTHAPPPQPPPPPLPRGTPKSTPRIDAEALSRDHWGTSQSTPTSSSSTARTSTRQPPPHSATAPPLASSPSGPTTSTPTTNTTSTAANSETGPGSGSVVGSGAQGRGGGGGANRGSARGRGGVTTGQGRGRGSSGETSTTTSTPPIFFGGGLHEHCHRHPNLGWRFVCHSGSHHPHSHHIHMPPPQGQHQPHCPHYQLPSSSSATATTSSQSSTSSSSSSSSGTTHVSQSASSSFSWAPPPYPASFNPNFPFSYPSHSFFHPTPSFPPPNGVVHPAAAMLIPGYFTRVSPTHGYPLPPPPPGAAAFYPAPPAAPSMFSPASMSRNHHHSERGTENVNDSLARSSRSPRATTTSTGAGVVSVTSATGEVRTFPRRPVSHAWTGRTPTSVLTNPNVSTLDPSRPHGPTGLPATRRHRYGSASHSSDSQSATTASSTHHHRPSRALPIVPPGARAARPRSSPQRSPTLTAIATSTSSHDLENEQTQQRRRAHSAGPPPGLGRNSSESSEEAFPAQPRWLSESLGGWPSEQEEELEDRDVESEAENAWMNDFFEFGEGDDDDDDDGYADLDDMDDGRFFFSSAAAPELDRPNHIPMFFPSSIHQSASGRENVQIEMPKRKPRPAQETETTRCPICLENVPNCVIDGCGHPFCTTCLEKHLESAPSPLCPTCRHRITRAVDLFL